MNMGALKERHKHIEVCKVLYADDIKVFCRNIKGTSGISLEAGNVSYEDIEMGKDTVDPGKKTL